MMFMLSPLPRKINTHRPSLDFFLQIIRNVSLTFLYKGETPNSFPITLKQHKKKQSIDCPLS